MKFKPIALVVIGVLLGSTITLTLTRPSASTTEILACTNRSSGTVRLLASGNCEPLIEDQTSVNDLQSIFSTSSSITTTTTEVKSLRKSVIDSAGKTIGMLTKEDGYETYFVRTNTGIWRYGISYPSISGFLNPIPLYFDSKCRNPYLVGFSQPDKLLHTAVDDQQKLIGYVASSGPLTKPNKAWIIQTTRDQDTEEILETKCLQWNAGDPLEVETGAEFFRSVKVPLVSYKPPLKIVEK